MDLCIPRYPLLTWPHWHAARREDIGCVLDAAHVAYATSGRMATALALQSMGIGEGDEVLLPAYHCPTMVHPVRWTGATPRFYPLQPDLTPALEALRRQVGQRTRVVVAAHFFGFRVDLRPLRTLCDGLGLKLVEDCAHSLYGGSRQDPVGNLGDYAVSSLTKFFPVSDGGCLTSRLHPLDDVLLRSGGVGFEMRACSNALERSVAHGRLPGLSLPLRAVFLAKDTMLKMRRPWAAPQGPAAAAPPDRDLKHPDFDPAFVHTRMSRFSRLVTASSNHAHGIARRRAAYARMLGAFSGLPRCRPLRAVLPDGVVPYVFPLWLDEPEQPYQAMQRAGMPVMRWDQLSASAGDVPCATSAACARHLIQIPCHQTMTDEETGRLIACVSQAIAGQVCNPPAR